MNIKIYLWVGILFLALSTGAIAQSAKVIVGSQSDNGKPTFQVSKNDLVLEVILPRVAKNISNIPITFVLANHTDRKFSFQEMEGVLEGMRFKLQDSSGKLLPMTKNGEAEMGHFAMAYHHEHLQTNQSLSITVPIRDYIFIRNTGRYFLTVSWGEDKAGDDPYGPPRPPALRLKRSFLLQRSVKGVVIFPTNQ
jgi:hypothetical protein